jgi:hypothetical protein
MTTPPIGVERRVGQRFPYLLSLSLRQPSTSVEGMGFTQDVSSRGVFFFTDAALTPGAEIEITLRMPSEITLGESMPVRCRGRILRVIRPSAPSGSDSARIEAKPCESKTSESKIGVAVRFDGYEYLPEASPASANFPRVATLHSRPDEPQPVVQSSARPVLG